MQSNRHFADFWETNSAFFNSDTIGIINAPETIIVEFNIDLSSGYDEESSMEDSLKSFQASLQW
jgi:hypothetical protein